MDSETLIQQWRETRDEGRLPDLKKKTIPLPHPNPAELDKEILARHEHFSACIDCLVCANCCKTTVTVFNDEDVGRASRALAISKKNLSKIPHRRSRGVYHHLHSLPILLPDNKCGIYEAVPTHAVPSRIRVVLIFEEIESSSAKS